MMYALFFVIGGAFFLACGDTDLAVEREVPGTSMCTRSFWIAEQDQRSAKQLFELGFHCRMRCGNCDQLVKSFTTEM